MAIKIRKRIIVSLFAFAIGFFCAKGFPQTKPTKPIPDELSKRIEALELEKDYLKNNINNQKESLNDKFDNKSESLDNHIFIMKFLFGVLGFIGLSSLISGYFYIKKKTKQLVDEKIEKILDEKTKEFLELARKQTEEFQLKIEKKILVLTPPLCDTYMLKKFFEGEGFYHVTFDTSNNFSNRNLEDYHIVLFNNEEKKFEQELIVNIVNNTQEVLFVYFGPPSDASAKIVGKKNVALANYRAQLYGNLINALRFQKYISIK